jgi:diguanylate cyclase
MNPKFLYLASERLSDSPTVSQLHNYLPPVRHNTACLKVLENFLDDATLYALPVVDEQNVPIALLDRHVFVEYFTRPYVREIHGRKGVAKFLRDASEFSSSPPIVVDGDTSIDDVAQMIISAGMQHMVTGFIVTGEGVYQGVANGHDLLNEITQRKQADLYHLAHFDQLTGIPNRMLFADRLMQACRDASRNGTLVGLMFVDVDRFKQVNDSMGHGFGDLLLRTVADRLRGCARDADTVGRLGGDEFAILMDDLKDSDDPRIVAQRIVESMNAPMQIAGRSLSITVSIGIAIYPTDDDDVAALLAKADTAMYEAKTSGRNGFRCYVPGLSIYDPAQMTLETDLRRAVERDEFLLHYQPQVSLDTGQVIGVEALIRWQHPVRGLIPPSYFIPLAEETGIVVGIGTWVLRQACIQHCRWRDAGLPPLQMAVNIAALQFRQENFAELVRSIVVETGIDPRYLELEMTEGTVMLNAASVLATLNELKAIGVRLAIDDFGTGYSNLNYLKHFPIDSLKIDRSFIRNIDDSPVNESIVRAVVALANCLSVKTVAEGAESAAEMQVVKDCLCGSAQGFHFAKPLTADEFSAWLAEFPSGKIPEDCLLTQGA